MRRLLLLVCALVAVDTMLYAALTPLLPHFADDLHLSKTGAGVLVAAYAAGAPLAGLPRDLATPRLAVPPHPELPSAAALRRAVRSSLFLGGLLLMALPSLLWGVLSTLAPLQLADFGWGAAAIGAVWLVGAAFEAALSPLAGRMVDRRGVLVPVQLALAVGAVVSVGLAVGPRPLVYVPLLIAASGAYGVLFTPAFALIADGAERSGLPQGMAFGLMNAAWASGALIGPAVGVAVAAATGDIVPFLVSAVLCAAALAMVRRTRLRTTAHAVPSDLAG